MQYFLINYHIIFFTVMLFRVFDLYFAFSMNFMEFFFLKDEFRQITTVIKWQMNPILICIYYILSKIISFYVCLWQWLPKTIAKKKAGNLNENSPRQVLMQLRQRFLIFKSWGPLSLYALNC